MQNKLEKDEKWVHFIGVGGVTMAPLAIELAKADYTVTGSDKELYDPIKGLIESSNIKINKEFDYKNLISNEKIPGHVICGSGISLSNREYLFAKKQSIEIKHYPEVLSEKVIVPESIVVAGTFAKTTVTSMLVNIFKNAGKRISYMFGALPVDGSSSIGFKNNGEPATEYSIVEGDEYISSRWDTKSKFFNYSPKYLVITALEWDHTDVFLTKEDYINNFIELVKAVPEDGFILLIGGQDKDFVLKGAKCKTERINVDDLMTWGEQNHIETGLIGRYNLINACISAYFVEKFEKANITMEQVRTSLAGFKGIKRRMEKRYSSTDGSIMVFDDFASSAAKVHGSLSAIKEAFPEHKIVAIYEPNIGSRTNEALSNFTDVFKQADYVLLPEFTAITKSDNYPVTNELLMSKLRNQGIDCKTCGADAALINYCLELKENNPKIVFIFMASSGMEERIAALLAGLSK